jgi:hypothetical protein
MTRFIVIFLLIACFLSGFVLAGQDDVQKTMGFIKEIAATSYPEIKPEKIRVKTFKSDSNYFKARFSFARFLTFQKMRYLVYVNPEVYQKNISDEAVIGILAHELAHVLYYTEKNRFELLGLTSLASEGFTTKFERRADLVTITRGYGEGLIKYREWLYQNIPADKLDDKKRDYFTPEEIRILIPALSKNPELIEKLKDDVPRNLAETQKAIK